MRVTCDEIWATPSTLHIRVLVHDSQGKWRHKYWVAVPVSEIPEEAVAALWVGLVDDRSPDDVALPGM